MNAKLKILIVANMPITLMLTLLLSMVTSCQNQNNEKNGESTTLFRIDVKKVIESKNEVPLSEVATGVQYIPLETNKDIYLSEIVSISITESYIFVLDNKSNLLQFGRNGKYICKIGNMGHGPGEYIFIHGFVASEKMNTIVVSDESRLIRYDMTGNYIAFSNHIGSFCIENCPDRFAFYKASHTQRPENLIVTDQNLVELKKYVNNNPKPKSSRGNLKAPLYSFNGNLFFKEHYNDTLFMIKDSIKEPYAIIEEKDMIMDNSLEIDPFNVPKIYDNKLTTENIFESNKYMLVSYIQGSRMPGTKIGYIRLLLNKDSNNALCLEGGTFSNDVDGGFNFWPNIIFSDNTLVRHINAIEFKAHVASEAFKNSTPKYPEKKRELEKLANSLSNDDNPVLMLVKLKE
jgi:hypothetical protein